MTLQAGLDQSNRWCGRRPPEESALKWFNDAASANVVADGGLPACAYLMGDFGRLRAPLFGSFILSRAREPYGAVTGNDGNE
jgi:hypothetical protein